jgi:hypothetical protein
MATATQTISTNATPFQGGVAAVTGTEESFSVTFSGTWIEGEDWVFTLTDVTSGLQTNLGQGYVTGTMPTYLSTFSQKVYALSGNSVFMSAVNTPLTWNDSNATGNGFVQLTDWWSTPEPVVAMAPYQGKLAFFARNTTWIFNVDANIANWSLSQLLTDFGTNAPASVKAIGDLDVLALNDNGIRSLRVRDSSLNAFVTDIGSPVDVQVVNAMQKAGAALTALACAGVEPSSNRYMLCLNGLIYALSYFPANKILAWSTYSVVDNAGLSFTPSLFFVYQGQLWLYGLDSNNVPAAYQYGGPSRIMYDSVKANWQIPFLDGKAPGIFKGATGVNIVCNAPQGGVALVSPDTWKVYASMDEKSAGDPTSADPATLEWTLVYNNSASSFDTDIQSYTDRGTHFSLCGVSQGDGGGTGGPATFSALVLHYNSENEEG